MRTKIQTSPLALLIGACWAICSPSLADDVDGPLPPHQDASESWYNAQQPAYQPNPRAIIHAKALARGRQRQARLEMASWYQMASARPTVPVLLGPYSPTSYSPIPAPRSWIEQNSVIVGDDNHYQPISQRAGRRAYPWYTSRGAAEVDPR